MKITDKLIGGLFKYMYGMGSKEQEAYLAKLFGKNRRSAKRNPIFNTRGAYYELDHLRRLHKSGRSKENPMDCIYGATSEIWGKIPKGFDFAGKLVAVPIQFGGEEKT